MTEFFDLSQPVQPGMTIFPGDPQPAFGTAAGVAAPWRVTELHLGTHTGTHIDAASHYVAHGTTIDQYPLERLILPGLVIDLPGLTDDQAVEAGVLSGRLLGLPKGGAVLIRTGWDRFWNTERYLRHPYLAVEAAQGLAEANAGLVGIDALNVDSTAQASEQVHRVLLGQDILIVENLARLNGLQPGQLYQFSFLPILMPGLDGSPVRAVAWSNH